MEVKKYGIFLFAYSVLAFSTHLTPHSSNKALYRPYKGCILNLANKWMAAPYRSNYMELYTGNISSAFIHDFLDYLLIFRKSDMLISLHIDKPLSPTGTVNHLTIILFDSFTVFHKMFKHLHNTRCERYFLVFPYGFASQNQKDVVEFVFTYFRSMYISYVNVVPLTNDHQTLFLIYNYEGYKNVGYVLCNQIFPNVVGHYYWDNQSDGVIVENQTLFKRFKSDFHGCPLKVGVIEAQPYVTRSIGKQVESLGRYNVRLIQFLIESVNATAEWHFITKKDTIFEIFEMVSLYSLLNYIKLKIVCRLWLLLIQIHKTFSVDNLKCLFEGKRCPIFMKLYIRSKFDLSTKDGATFLSFVYISHFIS